jgi:hypothetical protein
VKELGESRPDRVAGGLWCRRGREGVLYLPDEGANGRCVEDELDAHTGKRRRPRLTTELGS